MAISVDRTVGTWISALVIVTENIAAEREISIVTLVPSGPWMRVVAWSEVIPFMSLSPTFTISSPARSPAAAAGDPGTVPVMTGYPVVKLR